MARFLFLLALLMAGTASAGPKVMKDTRAASEIRYSVLFDATTTASELLPARGICVATFIRAGSETVTLYQTTASTATGGTAVATFSATTTSPTSITYGQPSLYAVSDGATAGGTLTVHCSPTQVSGGGGDQDADNDGLYEVAYLWDADGDGSTWTTCTANATPDIGCKAEGERLYRDAIDDINCAVHGCSNGRMEKSGTLILGEGVYVGWPCWTPTNANTPEAHETNDNAHDEANASNDPAYDDCPVDEEGRAMTVVSFQAWGGILLGSGADTRLLERGSMSTSLRRDIGTYFANDMGPWDATKNNNVWFSGGDNARMISTGYHNNVTDLNHPNGADATVDSTSKGWWKTWAATDWTAWTADGQQLCLRHLVGSGGETGVAGTDYKTVGTVTNLRAGDVLIVPAKPYSTGSNNTYELIVQGTPSGTCGSNNLGIWVPVGGTYINRTTTSTKIYPPHSSTTSLGDRVLHARSGYDNTRVTIANMRLEPMDPWNEFGGRCTASGTAYKTLVTDTGTSFLTATDDTNTDMSCDTLPFFGIWGGGQVDIQNVVVSNFHKFAVDAGGTGYADITDSTFIYGNGGEIADSSNGWRFHNILVDQSSFSASVIAIFGTAPMVDFVTLRNSQFSTVIALDGQSEMASIRNIFNESNTFANTIRVNCGTKFATVENIFQTGRGVGTQGGTPAAVYIPCDDAANPATLNTFRDVIVDAPDAALNSQSAPVIAFHITTDNLADASGDGTDETSTVGWNGIIGNAFYGIRSTGYVGGAAGESSCLYAVAEEGTDSPADDDGESVIFTKNFFSGGAVESNGRTFCVFNSGTGAIEYGDIDSTGAATPAWGDPVGCGNFDGAAVYADENCS